MAKITATRRENSSARWNREVPGATTAPFILLIGQKCMSRNESFVGMMTGDPDLTTMGNHTCGSSGNLDGVPESNGMELR